ncbi:MAG: aspartate carbamoyltransferase catalytic subunit [Chloroflexota bacterium]
MTVDEQLLKERPAEAIAEAAEGAFPAGEWPGRKHVLDLDDFSTGEIYHVLGIAEVMKEILKRPIPRVPALRGKTVVNLFYEPSTRTRISFELAAKSLGADTINVTASGSSVEKGESLLDSLRTLRALGATALVMRHSSSGAPYLAAHELAGSVINAGDGWHAHPTQALLDLFTLREHFGHLAGINVTILGDVLHSRVARSNIWGLTKVGANVTLCGPPTLLPSTCIPPVATGDWPRTVKVELDADRAIEHADVVMVLRLQRERQQAGLLPNIREYVQRYGLSVERVKAKLPDGLVMHPGPMNEGIEIDPEVAHGAQSLIEAQVTNGVALRMALLYLLCGGVPGLTEGRP